MQFTLDRSNREGSVAESGDGASGPGASATPHPPPVPDHTAGIHPPPDGFHEPVDPPWGRPVEPVPPSTPAVAVGGVIGESVLPLPLAALADGGSESRTTDSPQTRARTKFALKADLDVRSKPSLAFHWRLTSPPLTGAQARSGCKSGCKP